MTPLRTTGVQAWPAAAVLFGAGTPIAKLLLDSVSPWLLAGLRYLGSGLLRLIRRSPRVRILRSEMLPLATAVGLGGILGPVLLMFGLLGMAAIVAGAVVLSIPSGADLGTVLPLLAILGACLRWGIDNNLTRKIALTDATRLAAVKPGR